VLRSSRRRSCAAPEDVRGLLMVVGGVLYLLAIVGGYVIESRLYW
jgi:hypothetical protein